MHSNLKDSSPPTSSRAQRAHLDALIHGRAQIIAEHQTLRALLEHALRLAYEEPTRGAYMDDLKQRLRDLVQAFAAHLDTEEKVLAAVLEGCEGFGSMWRARLQEEHAVQRILLVSMLARVEGDAAPGSLAFEARRFARHLLEDMDHEERDLVRLVASEEAAADWLTQTG